jgi:hypothetical protein
MLLEGGEAVFSRQCADERLARYVAESARKGSAANRLGDGRKKSDGTVMVFTGFVQFRSSLRPRTSLDEIPGESEIQKNNDEHVARIQEVAGWRTLSEGSLNLLVPGVVLTRLGQLTPDLDEDATTLRYPSQHAHIPRLRKRYWYYLGIARRGDQSEQVLVRRPMNCAGLSTVEAFAPVSLTARFGLRENDHLEIEINQKDDDPLKE